MHNLL